MRLFALLAVLGAGCFDPQLPPGIACTAGACPSGLICDRGVCRGALSDVDGGAADAIDANCSTVTFREGPNYNGTADTTLDAGAATMDFGADSRFSWDLESMAGFPNVGLLRFDDIVGDGDGKVPTEAVVQSATLTVEIDNEGGQPPGTLREVLVSWDEQTTWDTFGAAPGIEGDIGSVVAPLPSAEASHDIDVTSSFVPLTSDHRGWAFVSESSNGVDAYSSEANGESTRPSVSITYCD